MNTLEWLVQPWRILQGLEEFLHALKDNILKQNKTIKDQNLRIKALETTVSDGVRDMRKQFADELRSVNRR